MSDDEFESVAEGTLAKMRYMGMIDGDKPMLQDGDGRIFICEEAHPSDVARRLGKRSRRDSCSSSSCDPRKRYKGRGMGARGVGIYARIPEDTEIKVIDHWTGPSGDQTITSEPIWVTLNAIKQGDNYYNRIGKRCVMKNLRVFYRIQLNDNGLGRADVIRVLVIYDRSPANQAGKGIIPQKNTVIAAVNADGTLRHTSEDNMNPTQSARFMFLRDDKIFMANDGNGLTDNSTNGYLAGTDRSAKVANEFEIDLKGLVTEYKPHAVGETDPSIEQIMSGALYLMVFGLHPEDPGWNLHWSARLHYCDY